MEHTEKSQIISTFSSIKKGSDKNLMVASTYFTKDLQINFELLVSRLKALDCLQLIIVYVYSGDVPTNLIKLDNYLGFYEISFSNLFTDKLFIDAVLKKSKFLNHLVFIFEDKKWVEIISLFKSNNITINGGSNTSKHILSPVQFKLAQFISCLEGMDYKKVGDSYHLSRKED